jgi:WD40 repeat protein
MKSATTLLALVLTSAAVAQGPLRDRGRFSLEGNPATILATDREVKYTLIAFENGMVCVFPANQRTVHLYAYPIHKKAVTAAIFTPDTKSFVTTSLDGTLKVWDVLAARKHHEEMEAKAGGAKPAVPTPTRTVSPHPGYGVTALALSPDGKQWATGASDGSVKVWRADTAKLSAAMLVAHPGGVKALQFSPDGKSLASAGADKTVKLWDPGTTDEKPMPVRTLTGHEGAVNALSFSPEGNHLAAGTGVAKKSGSIHVWDVPNGKRAYKLEGHTDVVTCVVFHPKTNHLASGGADKRIRVWDLKEKVQQYEDEHAEPLRHLVITADGVRFGSVSAQSVRWWAGFGK